MSDFNLPTLDSTYIDFLNQLKSRDVDSLTLCLSTPNNPPIGAIKYDRANNKFQEYNGSSFVDKILSISGGGTGASMAAGARANLGLGTLATQNNSAVNITGGSITGVSLDASGLSSGVVALARGGTGASLGIGAAGTFLRSNGSAVSFGTDGSALTNLNASALASGTVSAARLPPGVGYVSRILNFSTATTFTITTSYTDSPLTLTITPTSAANRLRIEASLNLYLLTLLVSTAIPSTDVHVDALLVRNGITVREWRYVANFQTGVGVTSSPQPVNVGPYGNIAGNYYLSVIDSPASTAALTYTIRLRMGTINGSNIQAYLNASSGTSHSDITITEIGA